MNIRDARQTVELFHLLFLDMLGRKLDKRNYVLKVADFITEGREV